MIDEGLLLLAGVILLGLLFCLALLWQRARCHRKRRQAASAPAVAETASASCQFFFRQRHADADIQQSIRLKTQYYVRPTQAEGDYIVEEQAGPSDEQVGVGACEVSDELPDEEQLYRHHKAS